MYELSEHAKQRMQQRGIPFSALEYIIKHSKPRHKAGAIFFYLRDRDIPEEDKNDEQISRLAGTAVVTSTDRLCIITIWRNRENGMKTIKCKPTYGYYGYQVN